MHIGLVTRSQVDIALDMANELVEKGVSVSLYMPHGELAQEVGTPDHPVERLYEVGLVPRECRVHLLQPPRMRDLRSFLLFRKLAQSMQDDGIELAHILLNDGEIWFAMLACLLHNIPVVTTMIIPKANVGDRLPSSIVWAVNKLAAYGSDAVIVNGAEQVKLVQKLYNLPANRVIYVPLNVRTTAIKWSDGTVPEEPGTVLFFGRAHPHKGLEYLVRAQPHISRRIPHARILISAHGEDLERCRNMIQDPSKFEIIEGVVPGDVMATLFQRAAVVALPYLSASTSGVLTTAFSFAKPVVATRVGCLPEYVGDDIRGILVDPGNEQQLADAIVRLLSDDALRRKMGENAARWMEERQEKITMQTLRVYERAVAWHKNGVRRGLMRRVWASTR